MNGIEASLKIAKRDVPAQQRGQRFMDYSLKGLLTPRTLQRKTKGDLMENPTARWLDFSARTVQRHISFQVYSNFLNDEEQIKTKMAALRQDMKNLQSDLQEHRVIAVEKISDPVVPNQNARQVATQFCKNFSTIGHTPSWCRSMIRDEETKRIETERTAERKVMFTLNYNGNR